MAAFFTELRETVLWDRNGKDGPLPPLLVSMTFVTGLVDAFSYLVLGHVFVANMTGNVVLLGFALVGAPGFSIVASVTAIASFGLGSVAGGRIGARFSDHRGRQLSFATFLQAACLAAGVILAALGASEPSAGYRYSLIVVLAIAMGVQNATARKLAVADLTTTVLTLTITGIAADSTIGGGKASRSGRRLVAVGTMLAGAVGGAAFIIHHEIVFPLLIALLVALGVGTAAGVLGRWSPSWAVSQG
jgi:uncharacterized membrane protein YoaK (UPF0700 family)